MAANESEEIRVAVIAVHGVGDHVPHETAQGVADLLVNLNRDSRAPAHYALFAEEKVEVALVKPGVSDRTPVAGEHRDEGGIRTMLRMDVFNERPQFLQELHSCKEVEECRDPRDFGCEFMRDQVEQVTVTPQEPPYRTVRFKSVRKRRVESRESRVESRESGGGSREPEETTVHVYEMFWDDLSGVGNGFLAIFGELYQLLFHLPSIGRKTVDFARAENPRSRLWRFHSNWQARAARFLTIPLPILNLFLLAAFLTALPGNLPAAAKPIVSLGVLPLVIAGIAFAGYLRLKRAPLKAGWRLVWMAAPLVGVALAWLIYLVVGEQWSGEKAPFGFDKLLAIEWWVLSGCAIAWLMGHYETMRPGAKSFAAVTAVFVAALLTVFLSTGDNSHQGATAAGFRIAEVVFTALVVSCGLFAVCAILAGLAGLVVSIGYVWRRRDPDPAARERSFRGERAAFTGRLSLALSMAGFLLVTLALYSGLTRATSGLLPVGPDYEPLIRTVMVWQWPASDIGSRVFPKSGMLHEADFQRPVTGRRESSLLNPIDAFASFLKSSGTSTEEVPAPTPLIPRRQDRWRTQEAARAHAVILREHSETINQLLAQYSYTPADRSALVQALNRLLREHTPASERSVTRGRVTVRDRVPSLDEFVQAVNAPGVRTPAHLARRDSQRVLFAIPPVDKNHLHDRRGFVPTEHEFQIARRKDLEDAFPGVFEEIEARSNLFYAEVIDRMLGLSATPTLIIALIAMALSLVLAVWALLPSVLSEAVGKLRQAEDGTGMGEWMDNGLRLLRLSGELLYWPTIVLLPVGSLLYLIVEMGGERLVASAAGLVGLRGALDLGLTWSSDIIAWLGLFVTSSAVGLIAFRGRIESLALGLRAPLQAALDVDNWMRESPRGATPRGKISVRYISLLRALLDPQRTSIHHKYDAIVIIAHSQGTVITADLLRFLHHRHDGGTPATELNHLEALGTTCPVYFLTVGSPLRQAYGSRFPHLYAWTRHSSAGARGPEAAWSIDPQLDPRPEELGLERWVSAYRSGDYIGRYFWFSDCCDTPWAVFEPDGAPPPRVSQDPEGRRRELCIGPGAHVHYFDLEMGRGAAIVARELDDLIARAAAKARERRVIGDQSSLVSEAAAAHRNGKGPLGLLAAIGAVCAAAATLWAAAERTGRDPSSES